MPTSAENNKRIAKNTLLLYFRMMFMMVVALYTSRLLLNRLGVSDYGIFNAVGGFVSMFTILSGALSSAISRFITYELGAHDLKKLKIIFCTGINIQVILSILVIIIAESIGLWFLNTQMNIPASRMTAANWVFQFSIVAFVLNLINVPFNAEIIAHEHMSAFAWISIIDVSLKCLVAYIIAWAPIDELVYYSLLYAIECLIIRCVYGIYCKRNFEECTYHTLFDKTIFKQMLSFAGWNFLGSSAGILNTQGINLLINIFFGVTVNAARGIAVQVDSAVKQFVSSFATAVNPQITKSYAEGDYTYVQKLVCYSAKYSSYLLLYLAVPIVIEAQEILHIWLGVVPEYAVIFVQLTVISTFADYVLGNSMMTAILATGKIKAYQIAVTILGGSVFPITWVAYYLGASPEWAYIIYCLIYVGVIFVRVHYMKVQVGMDPAFYYKKVLLRVIPVMALSFAIPYFVIIWMNQGIVRVVVTTFLATLSTTIIIALMGLSDRERKKFLSMANNFLKHKHIRK